MKKCIKRYLPIFISFLVVVGSISTLVYLNSIYKSKKINLVHEFEESVVYDNGMLTGQNKTYFFNSYGGSVSESDIMTIPLSQYGGPDSDYIFSNLKAVYYAVDSNKVFNGCNETYMFLCEVDKVLYLVNTYDNDCTPINPDTDFHSASKGGSYLVEHSDSLYFYKRLNLNYELSNPVKINSDSVDLEICFWLNDQYLLIKDGNKYIVADAKSGETAECFSVSDGLSDVELISDIYYLSEKDDKNFSLLNVYTNEKFKYKHSLTADSIIFAVSSDGKYAAISDEDVFVVSNKGKSFNLSKSVGYKISSADFIENNILLVTFNKDGVELSSIYKIML